MSAMELAIKDAIYKSPLSVQAVFTDTSGDEILIRVLENVDADGFLAGAEPSVRGNRIVFYALRSDLVNKPRKGESIEVDSVVYLIDNVDERGLYEWTIHAYT